jgi:hypothetical protein
LLLSDGEHDAPHLFNPDPPGSCRSLSGGAKGETGLQGQTGLAARRIVDSACQGAREIGTRTVITPDAHPPPRTVRNESQRLLAATTRLAVACLAAAL